MENNDLDRRFFTNTYITGVGRRNYLRIDNLEDPLFTSFTFDIDYVTSPLFYTINYSDYGYPNVEGMAEQIEASLEYMYGELSQDQGYDILPTLSASILDGNKLGFGLQQNVYMDTPLYGATEYIYMVDKRNCESNQNDVRYDSNRFAEFGGNPNSLNSFKLGDSIKEIVNDSDKEWAERNKNANEQQVSACDEILTDENVKAEHRVNIDAYEAALLAVNNATVSVDGEKDEQGNDKKFTESQIQQKLNELKKMDSEFEQFKRDIVGWANVILTGYQNTGTKIYTENKCFQNIVKYENINDKTKDEYTEKFKKMFGENFASDLESYAVKFEKLYNEDIFKNFLTNNGGDVIIIKEKVIEKFSDKLEYFDLMEKGSNTFSGNIMVNELNTPPDWALKFYSHASYFSDNPKSYSKIDEKIKSIMSYKCDFDLAFDDKFTSKSISENESNIDKYESALDEIRYELYGMNENGEICDKNNASPDSLYGQLLEAEKTLKNDDYSQAEKAKSIAESESSLMSKMISDDEENQKLMEQNYNSSIQMGEQPLEVNRNQSLVASQTVLDMIGFITGMKKMTMKYPYIIQGVTGLDTAYNKNYGIKDPYLGSGDDKITLTCLESLDLRVSSMFNRYFNAVYDRQYRRERVPINLRRFNCSIYVHDVRNFVAKSRYNKKGEQKVTYNRLLELTDMYHSVIEFRFFDCEIIPEETGNIFNDISNEAPSDMKKTNFTFKYGNCVVNFVPSSEVASHNVN